MPFRVTLKFLKDQPHTGVAVRLCPNDQAIEYDDPTYSVDNTRETIVCLAVQEGEPVSLKFDLLAPVRRVVLDGVDIAFFATDNHLTLSCPALTQNIDRTADMHMIVPSSGVDLRIEVPDATRASGKYTQDDFPTRARKATTTLEFALLEAIRGLGLDKTIGQGPCGPIYLMGFDTNNPCGHTDWPPHVHMHMARPARGAPIGHYYFDETLRLSHNDLYLRGSAVTESRFGPGDPCPHHAPDGSLMFDLTITPQGGFAVSDSADHTAIIAAIGAGFDSGAKVSIAGRDIDVCASHKDYDGLVSVVIDGHETHYFYDPDTGRFIGQKQIVSANGTAL